MFNYSQMAVVTHRAYSLRMGLNIHIREIRQKKGLRLADLAEMIGVSVAHMSQIERGIRNLNNHLLIRLSEALDVPPQNLVTGEGTADLTRLNFVLGKLSDEDLARVEAFANALLRTEEKIPHT